MKVNDENGRIRIQDPDPDPDPPQNVMDPQHCWEVVAGTPGRRVEATSWCRCRCWLAVLVLHPVIFIWLTTCQHFRSKVSRSILQSSFLCLGFSFSWQLYGWRRIYMYETSRTSFRPSVELSWSWLMGSPVSCGGQNLPLVYLTRVTAEPTLK